MMVVDKKAALSNLFPLLMFVGEIVYFPAMYRQLFLINWPQQLTSREQIYPGSGKRGVDLSVVFDLRKMKSHPQFDTGIIWQ